jgi:PleD family two-component response regulator
MGRKVLVVDDDALILEVTAAEQLERDQSIEILITDINMPEMDGYELVD